MDPDSAPRATPPIRPTVDDVEHAHLKDPGDASHVMHRYDNRLVAFVEGRSDVVRVSQGCAPSSTCPSGPCSDSSTAGWV